MKGFGAEGRQWRRGLAALLGAGVFLGAYAIFITDYESLLLKDLYFCAHTTDRLNEKYGVHYADSK